MLRQGPRFAFLTCVLALTASQALGAHEAAADELPAEPTRTASLLSGAAVAVVSMGVGLTLTANSGEGSVQNAGIVIAQSGLTLSPIVAHGVAGEWGRGVAFALPSAAAQGGMSGLMAYWGDHLVTGSALASQYVYSALFTASALTSVVGIVDAMFAGDRAEARAHQALRGRLGPLHLVPTFEPRSGSAGLSIGGFL